MHKFLVGVVVSAIGLAPAVVAAESSGAAQTTISFFCNQTADIPETVLIAEQDKAITIAPVLVWTPLYFPDREVTLDLCRASAVRMQELQVAGAIGTHVFTADRQGEAIRVCLQPEDTIESCTNDTVVFTATVSNRPELVLYEMLPADTRAPLSRGDFPTVHPAFPFSFSSFFGF